VAADGLAREEKRSLFAGLTVPPSHATLPFVNQDAVGGAIESGFTHVKVKAGREVVKELATVRRLIKDWPEIRWRIDFNGTGVRAELEEVFKAWSEEERAKIDFLEDPVDYRSLDWLGLQKALGVTVANDRWVDSDRGDSEVLVVKPAVQEIPATLRMMIVTSYLDHPLGQAFAAWEAARAGVDEVCGLQSHGVFEATPFTEALGPVQPDFQVPEGFGLGFDHLLEALPWRKLA
jgi:O-succinylbenzoate synthase